jgi:hypothetical protein
MIVNEKLSAGKEVLSYCGKCKMDLTHTIIAMQGDRIVRVHCKTCKGDHGYKSPKGINDPNVVPKESKRRIVGASGAASRTPTKVSVEEEWSRLMNEHRSHPMKEYAADSHFGIHDRIKHPIFGEGVVTKTLYPNKIEIVFSMDVKVLIHAPSAS